MAPRLTALARRHGSVLLVVLALVAVLAGCWLLYLNESRRIGEQHLEREVLRVGLLAQLMRSELGPAVETLRLLADGDGLRNYLDTGSAAGLEAAARRAQFTIEGRADYDQLRFIAADGREVMRVTRSGIVPPQQLQDRSMRQYFQAAMALGQGTAYVSGPDVSGDNGSIEQPLNPVLRFAMPVFDTSGRKRGVYVINYLGANLINRLQQAIPAYGHRLRLLDAGGFWIRGADPGEEWGFAVAGRAGHTVAVSNPLLWARIQAQPAGQHGGEGGVFTWLRLQPAEMLGALPGELVSAQPFWIIASQVSAAEWHAMFAGLRQVMLFTVPALVLLMLLSAGLFRARHRVLLELRSVNQALEQRVRDRTAELARMNDELRERESLLEETGRLAKVGGWEFTPATGQGTWTPEIARIHELDVAIRPTREMGLQFYTSQSRARLEAALLKSIADGTPYDLELELVTALGTHKWVRTISRPVLEDGRVVRMRGALQDITERKLTELRLQAQLQRLHLLERTTRAIGERQDVASILQVVIGTLEAQLPLDFGCVCTHDAADRALTVTALGAASVRLAPQLSMTRGARIAVEENGLSACIEGRLVCEGDLEAVQAPLAQRLSAAGLRSLVAAPLQVEGRVFGVLLAARRTPGGFSSSDAEFLRQVSEHAALAANQAQLHAALEAAYQDLHATQQAVMQQERLRVLGQMSSGIAHDINNAISPIMLYTDSLLESEQLSERARQSLITIQQAVSDVAETVARMREFYRHREAQVELEPVQLNALVAQTRELTRARWETMPQQHGIVIELRLELEEGLPPVLGIANEIREALVNLVFNAVDAMPGGGNLTLRTRHAGSDTVLVEVVDTGTGMDEETRRRCLEPFFTTKGERGTGLGLAMVYGTMQRLNGYVEIDSAPGQGTTVRLGLAAAAVEEASGTTARLPVPTGLRLLLVDDDPILLRSLREVLEIDGHLIEAADAGEKGIQAFRDSLQPGATRFSAVITDLGMPHVDGRMVAGTVKQMAPEVPVILLTGWGERLLAEGRAIPHVDRVLGKPPRMRDLRQALAELVPGARTP